MKKIELSEKQKEAAQQILSQYKTYKKFSGNKDKAYKFTSIIGVIVCPYCNIEYIYTVYDKNGHPILRPDIDHFIPKNKTTGNQILQLELDNLIPSCKTCNERLKRDKAFSRKMHIHPYFDDFDSIMEFRIELNSTDYLYEQGFDIKLIACASAAAADVVRAKNNISVFKLNERYQFHRYEVVNLFKRMKYYNSAKQNELFSFFGKRIENYSNMALLFPEKYCSINDTSLGKLKKDVIMNYL